MEENIEKPMSLDEIATATGLSRRQIERLFKRHLDCVPEELLPADAPAPRARTAAADRDADHRHHDRLRLSVAAAFLAVLPRAVRLPAERRAPDSPRHAAPRTPAGVRRDWLRPETGVCARGFALSRRLSLCGMRAVAKRPVPPVPSTYHLSQRCGTLTRSRAWRFRQWRAPKPNSTLTRPERSGARRAGPRRSVQRAEGRGRGSHAHFP